MKRRLIRIAPLYWAVTLLVAAGFLVGGHTIGWSELAHSLAFVAYPAGDTGLPPKPVLSVGWTLNLEMLFYLVMAGALFAPVRARLAILGGVLGALVLVGLVLPQTADPRVLFYTGGFMAEFLIGVGLGVLWTSGRIPRLERTSLLGVTAAIVFLALLPLDGASRLVAYGGFVALLVLLALMAEEGLSERQSIPLHVLGAASYSLYLTHLPVIFAFQALAAEGWLTLRGPALAIVALTAMLAVGLASYYGFERPVHRALMARRRVLREAYPA